MAQYGLILTGGKLSVSGGFSSAARYHGIAGNSSTSLLATEVQAETRIPASATIR